MTDNSIEDGVGSVRVCVVILQNKRNLKGAALAQMERGQN